MRTKEVATFEAKIYIGSRAGYGGEPFTQDQLVEFIQQIQVQAGRPEDVVSVRVSPTEFVAGKYREAGWEVTAICFPKFPRPHDEIRRFARTLAEHLLARFRQNRVSIVCPDRTVMIEADDAEMTPVC